MPQKNHKFHVCCGNNIQFRSDRTVARRARSYANGLTFSDRSLTPGELFLIEIDEYERGWSGHARIGFTQIDPVDLDRVGIPAYSLPDLVRLGHSWLYPIPDERNLASDNQTWIMLDNSEILAVLSSTNCCDIPSKIFRPDSCLANTTSFSRIGILYTKNPNSDEHVDFHMIVNGKVLSPYIGKIPIISDGPMFVVVDVYGRTKEVRIINFNYGLTLKNLCRAKILQCIRRDMVTSLPLPKMLQNFLLFRN